MSEEKIEEMTFEGKLMSESARIWKNFKPYFKDTPLSQEEWAELESVAKTEKYELPEGYGKPEVRTDSSKWKSALDFYGANYTSMVLKTIEKHQKEVKNGI